MTEPEPGLPAWMRHTAGEPRLAVSAAILLTLAVQLLVPDRLAFQPFWLLPTLELLLLVAMVVANPVRIDRESSVLRVCGLTLTTLISLATAWSVVRLVRGLLDNSFGGDAAALLGSGAAIWLTNVVVFALWYWEFDRGGPAARAHARRPLPDFLFVQMQNPELAPPEWEPRFLDYLYLSFTNSTAFSPTDVMPLSRWAKLTMMLQSAISLTTVALVIARAVNVLK
jgi:uncharacterized membrane protein